LDFGFSSWGYVFWVFCGVWSRGRSSLFIGTREGGRLAWWWGRPAPCGAHSSIPSFSNFLDSWLRDAFTCRRSMWCGGWKRMEESEGGGVNWCEVMWLRWVPWVCMSPVFVPYNHTSMQRKINFMYLWKIRILMMVFLYFSATTVIIIYQRFSCLVNINYMGL
jgi:hypothetical protein